jgi:MFS transporter, DHA2 family, multidrug resistance protein
MQTRPMNNGARISNSAAALNFEVDRQVALLGYINDFSVMMWLTIFAMPLLLFRTEAPAAPASGERIQRAHALTA